MQLKNLDVVDGIRVPFQFKIAGEGMAIVLFVHKYAPIESRGGEPGRGPLNGSNGFRVI